MLERARTGIFEGAADPCNHGQFCKGCSETNSALGCGEEPEIWAARGVSPTQGTPRADGHLPWPSWPFPPAASPGHPAWEWALDTLLGNGIWTPSLGMGCGTPSLGMALDTLLGDRLWTPSSGSVTEPSSALPGYRTDHSRHCRLSWARGEVIIAQVRPAGLSCHTAHFTVSSDTFVSEFIIEYADPQE